MTGVRAEGGSNRSEDGKPTRLKVALGELRDEKVVALFPLARTLSEGLQGAVEESNRHTDEKLGSIRTTVTGTETRMRTMVERAESIEAKARKVEELAGEASASAQHASSEATIAREEAQRAANSAGLVEQKLSEIAEREQNIPSLAVKALEVVVSGEVSDTDESGKETKTKKTGRELIQTVINRVENLSTMVGKVAGENENLTERVDALERSIQASGANQDETERLVGEAKEAAVRASSEAGEAKGILESFRGELTELAEGLVALQDQMSVIAKLLLGKAEISDPGVTETLQSAVREEEG